MDIQFLGAVESVTGSCHLIRYKDKNILLDCGQFQGSKREEEMNFGCFDFAPADIDYVFLSHSHIDHCGRIPLLVKRGFKGEIICSKPTYDLCQIMLIDSAHIHESEAEWKNRKAARAGRKMVEPLYTQSDAMDSLKYFKPVLYNQMIEVNEDITVRFNDAGHILGSSIIEMWFKTSTGTDKLVFTGDLGMKEKPILDDPTIIESADYVIIESTYGDRIHEKVDQRIDELIDIILKTTSRGGTVVIPSFAVGRTQEIIYELNRYYESNTQIANKLKNIPVYIDSPLATKATEVFKINSHVFDEEAKNFIKSGDNPLEFVNLHFTESAEESKALNFSKEPKIIISASGMCEAGRIRHHLKHNLWRKESSIVFVGYQAMNTLGRKLTDGEKQVRLFGEDITVEAEIYDLDGFSGHADKNGLLEWLSGLTKKPKKVFIVHGEPEVKINFKKEIEQKLGYDCIIPQKDAIYELNEADNVVVRDVNKPSSLADKTVTDKSLLPADREKIKELQQQIEEIKGLFTNTLSFTESHLNDDINIEEFNKVKNSILELENDVYNLTMLSGK